MIAVAAGRGARTSWPPWCPRQAWQRLSCADGSKGPRLYDWALVETASRGHCLLVRRSLHPNEKGELELAFFCCYAPRPATLAELVAVAGARWAVEDCFAEAKNETGLDHYQVRLPRLVPAHHLVDARARVPRRHAHALRPARAAGPPASGTPTASPLKRGPAACGQIFAPPRTYSPPPVITDENGRRADPAHRRRGPPPVQPPHPRHPPRGLPPALVRLATPPPGHAPAGPTTPAEPRSQGAVVVRGRPSYLVQRARSSIIAGEASTGVVIRGLDDEYRCRCRRSVGRCSS